MLIVCPQCATSYQVAPTSLGADGRSVRCVNCQTIWYATPTEPALESAAAWDTSDIQLSATDAANPGPDSPAFGTSDSGFSASSGDTPDDFSVTASDRLSSDDDFGAGSGSAEDAAFADVTAISSETEPAMMGDSPSIVPPIEDASGSVLAAHALPGEDIESLAARRQAERERGRFWLKLKAPNLATIIVMLIGVIVVLLAARNQVVQYAPQTAPLYAALGMPVNLRGLDFENIRVTRDTNEGIPVLVVEGKIVSSTKGIAEVPRLRFAIHDQNGKEVYTWTMMPSRTLLAAGETLPFRSRLASPPAEGRDVSIRFFNRRDVMTGFR